ncbi:MAG: hypothetical protein ACE1ZP_08890 [Myxococcota bacterium]
MTDSASILSVGLNGFEVLFDGLTGFASAAVGAAPVDWFAVSPVAFAVLSAGSDSGI